MKTVKEVREVVKERISIDEIKIVRKYDIVLEQTRDYNDLPFIKSVNLRLSEVAMSGNNVIYDVRHDFPLGEGEDLEAVYSDVMRDAEGYIFRSRRKLDLAINFARKLGLTEIYVVPADC